MQKYAYLIIALFSFSLANAQYNITVKVNGLGCGEELLLANHFGDKQYLKDTSTCNNGVFQFTGEETLGSGVYLVVLPNRNYFEIMVSSNEDQTKYYFEADTTLNAERMITKGSAENQVFFEFNKLAAQKGMEAGKLKEQYEATEDEKKKKKLQDAMSEISKVVAVERQKIASTHSEKFIGKLFGAMIDVAEPEAPDTMEEKDADRYKYLYVRSHYFDNVDMSEDGIVRSPVFHNKLKEFFTNYVPPMPDSAIKVIDNVITQIEEGGSKEQFKYAVHFFLNNSEKSKYMCFDKVLYHMASNYYCAGKAFWADSSFIDKICTEAAKMKPTLCDEIAPDLAMPDTTFSRRIVMSEIDKPVTILVFWDINCGHCKKEMPLISQYYDTANKEHVEIYAVYTQGDWEGWKKRLKEEKYKFINVANAFGDDDFRKDYNIRSTPQIYVLDQKKRVRFKKIAVGDFAKVVNFLLEDQGIIKKEEEPEKG
jgi:thiol-disulfide isomerase/thioredoxin